MKEKKQLSIKSVNVLFLTVIAVLCVSLLAAAINLALHFNQYSENSSNCFSVSKAALEIQTGSEYLTDEVRFFILSYDSKHMDNYFYERNVTRRREKAIEEIKNFTPVGEAQNVLEQALNESHELEKTEIYAIKLVIEGKHLESSINVPEEVINMQLEVEDQQLSDEYKVAKAWLLLFSEDYMYQKKTISDYNAKALADIIEYTEQMHTGSSSELEKSFSTILALIICVFAIAFVFIILLRQFVLKPLYKNVLHIKNKEKLSPSYTREFNILSTTYNEMYDKYEANEVLLRHKAEHDELTGLLNRGAWSQIKKALETSDSRIALILLDIDFFKVINDNYGHPVGDKVLTRVANALKDAFRSSDYIARVGGDEFVVILTNCDKNRKKVTSLISVKMSQIKDTLEQEVDGSPKVTLSCGIELGSSGYNDTLYEHADAALYEVKRSGRNGFKFYSSDMSMLLSQVEETH